MNETNFSFTCKDWSACHVYVTMFSTNNRMNICSLIVLVPDDLHVDRFGSIFEITILSICILLMQKNGWPTKNTHYLHIFFQFHAISWKYHWCHMVQYVRQFCWIDIVEQPVPRTYPLSLSSNLTSILPRYALCTWQFLTQPWGKVKLRIVHMHLHGYSSDL